MGLLTETIEYQGAEGAAYKLVLSQANIFMATRRVRMITDARNFVEKATKDGHELSVEEIFLRVSVFPNLTSCVVSGEGFEKLPIGFDEFASQLPEPFWDQWAEAVRRLNPQWYPIEADTSPKVLTSADETPTPSTSA